MKKVWNVINTTQNRLMIILLAFYCVCFIYLYFFTMSEAFSIVISVITIISFVVDGIGKHRSNVVEGGNGFIMEPVNRTLIIKVSTE